MATRRKAGKPPGQQPEPTVKLTLSVPADVARRFGVHAEMTGMGKGELFAELVRTGCRRFVVSDREQQRPGEVGEGQGSALAG